MREYADYLKQQYKKARNENLKMRIDFKYEDGGMGSVFVDLFPFDDGFRVGQFSMPNPKLSLNFKPQGYSVYWAIDLEDIIEIELLNKEGK